MNTVTLTVLRLLIKRDTQKEDILESHVWVQMRRRTREATNAMIMLSGIIMEVNVCLANFEKVFDRYADVE